MAFEGASQMTLYFVASLGLLFFLPPLLVVLYKLLFRWSCQKAQGRVLRIEKTYDSEADSHRLTPVIEFFDKKGGRFELRPGIRYGLRYLPAVHSTVKIYYRPETQPLKADVANRGLWQVSAILMMTGLLLMLPLLVLKLVLK